MNFSPAMSFQAKKAKGKQIRDWHLNRRSGSVLSDLARAINAQVRGWINYYGAFYRSQRATVRCRAGPSVRRCGEPPL
jgi:RNA-directed DNA polymerase